VVFQRAATYRAPFEKMCSCPDLPPIRKTPKTKTKTKKQTKQQT